MKKVVLLIGLITAVLIGCINNPEGANQNGGTTAEQDTVNKTCNTILATVDTFAEKKENEEGKR